MKITDISWKIGETRIRHPDIRQFHRELHLLKEFCRRLSQLQDILKKAIKHKGLFLHRRSPACVTFDKIDTYRYCRENIYRLESEKGYRVGDPVIQAVSFA